MSRKQIDLQTGLSGENQILPIINKKFGTTFSRTGKYCTYDFESNNVRVELKTRNNSSNKYPTTLFGANKIEDIDNDYEYYFVFKFTDKIMYIQYDEELFRTFSSGRGGRNDRGREEYKQYYFIPISELETL